MQSGIASQKKAKTLATEGSTSASEDGGSEQSSTEEPYRWDPAKEQEKFIRQELKKGTPKAITYSNAPGKIQEEVFDIDIPETTTPEETLELYKQHLAKADPDQLNYIESKTKAMESQLPIENTWHGYKKTSNEERDLNEQTHKAQVMAEALKWKKDQLNYKKDNTMRVLGLYFPEQTSQYYDYLSKRDEYANRFQPVVEAVMQIPKDEEGQFVPRDEKDVEVINAFNEISPQYHGYNDAVTNMKNDGIFGELISDVEKSDKEVYGVYQQAVQVQKENPEYAKKIEENERQQKLNDIMYEISPARKMQAMVDNQAGRAVTDFVKGLTYIPKMLGDRDDYGWTDKFYDESATFFEDFKLKSLPEPSKFKGSLVQNGEVQGELIIPKVVYGLTNVGLMVGTAAATGGAGAAVGVPTRTAQMIGTVMAGVTTSAESIYAEAKAAGMSEKDAINFSTALSLQQGMLEMVNPEIKVLSPSIAKEAVKTFTTQLAKGFTQKEAYKEAAKYVFKNMGQETLQETLQLLDEYANKAAANSIAGSEFDVENFKDQLAETLLITPLISLPFGAAGSKGKSRLQNEALYNAGLKPEESKAALTKMFESGQIDEEKLQELTTLVDKAGKAFNKMPKEMSDEQKVAILTPLMEKIEMEESAKNVDSSFKPVVEEKIAAKEKEIQDIVGIKTEEQEETVTPSPTTPETNDQQVTEKEVTNVETTGTEINEGSGEPGIIGTGEEQVRVRTDEKEGVETPTGESQVLSEDQTEEEVDPDEPTEDQLLDEEIEAFLPKKAITLNKKDKIPYGSKKGGFVEEAIQKRLLPEEREALKAAIKDVVNIPTNENHNRLIAVFTDAYESPFHNPSKGTKKLWRELNKTFPEIEKAGIISMKAEVRRNEMIPSGFDSSYLADAPRKIRGWFVEGFRSRGNLPAEVFARSIKMNSEINSIVREMGYTNRDFKKALKEVYGKKVSKEDQKKIDQALKGEIPIEEVPEGIHPFVQRMRNDVDTLSKRLIDEGLIEGELLARVQENLGAYLTRSYQMHDDPDGWNKFIATNPEGQQIRNRAVAYVRKEYEAMGEQLTDEEVEGIINELLFQEEGPLGYMSSGKLGSKDIGILKQRKDIAPEIRALMGEYTDPLLNYSRSIVKMANLIAKARFLNDVKEIGMGKFLFEKANEKHYAKVASDESKTYSPLNGLYTTPEIKKALEDFNGDTSVAPLWLRLYFGANGFVKYSKTILSVQTHVRNIVGNMGFVIMNGHWRAGKFSDAIKTVAADLGALDNTELEKRYIKYLRLGVVYDNPNAGELSDLVKDITGRKDGVDQIIDSQLVKAKNAVGGAINKLYQSEDDLFKIFAFENEKARYQKAYPEKSEAEIEEIAAGIVRSTYPTYSLVPKVVKSLRKFPLTGTFVSFPAEVIRTAGNTIALTRRELRNPKTREIGIQRMAGIITAISLPIIVSTISRALAGVDSEEEEDLRRFVAPWTKDSQMLFLSKEKGKYRYVDMSQSDPHAYLKRPFINLLFGEGTFKENATDALWSIFEPYMGEEILASKIGDIWRNKKANSGSPVYNEQLDMGDKMAEMYDHIAQAFEPGTIRSVRRIVSGIKGDLNEYGKVYNPVDESIALTTGQRIDEVDVASSLGFKVYAFSKDIKEADRIYEKVKFSKGKVTKEELQDAYEKANTALKRNVEEMIKDVQAARRLGVPDSEIVKYLNQNRLPKNIKAMVWMGKYTQLAK